jgi:hypothetical protein
VKADYYRSVAWSWASVTGSVVKVSVPSFADAGTYMAYLQVTVDDSTSLIPVAVTVPMTIGKIVKGEIDVSHDSSSTMTGEWVYYAVDVPEGSRALTAVLAWTDRNTCIDLYLIDPMGDPEAVSLTPLTANGLFGPWMTSTGVTAQVLSVQDPSAGMWMVGLHDTFLGKVFVEPYLLTATLTPPVEFDRKSITVSGSAEVAVVNDLLLPMSVRLAPVKNELAASTEYFNGVLKSINTGGDGFMNNLIEVAPGTVSMKLSISWGVPSADVSVVVYAADGSNRGILLSNGEELIISNPDPGVWDAVAMLDSTDQETAFTLAVESMAHPGWADLSVSPSVVNLGPLAVDMVELSASSAPETSSGMVVMYDAVTGSVYDTLGVTIESS